MTREDKSKVIEDLKEKFAENNFFYVADASGMTVAEINDFRRLCFEKGVSYHVLKNTMVKKALDTLEAD